MVTTPRILIQGLGSVGGVLACRLRRAGITPVIVTNNLSITEAVNHHGVQVSAGQESETAALHAYTLLEHVPRGERFDQVWLAMPAHAVLDAAVQAYPLLAPNAFAVSFQNGIVGDLLADALGPERVVSACVT